VTRSFKEILDWIEQGRLNPLAVMTFNLDAASEAMNTMKSRRSIGKIVLQDTDQ